MHAVHMPYSEWRRIWTEIVHGVVGAWFGSIHGQGNRERDAGGSMDGITFFSTLRAHASSDAQEPQSQEH